MEKITVKLAKFEKDSLVKAGSGLRKARLEFHINDGVRKEYGVEGGLFSLSGNVIFASVRQARGIAAKINAKGASAGRFVKAGDLFVMGLIDEILHYVVSLYQRQIGGNVFGRALGKISENLGSGQAQRLLESFCGEFPPSPVYGGEKSVKEYLESAHEGESALSISLEETMFLSLANLNPAYGPFKFMFDDKNMAAKTVYPQAIEELKAFFKDMPAFASSGMSLWDMLRAPALASPHSLAGQLEFMRRHWGLDLSRFMARMLIGIDVIREEEKPVFGGPDTDRAAVSSRFQMYSKRPVKNRSCFGS